MIPPGRGGIPAAHPRAPRPPPPGPPKAARSARNTDMTLSNIELGPPRPPIRALSRAGADSRHSLGGRERERERKRERERERERERCYAHLSRVVGAQEAWASP